MAMSREQIAADLERQLQALRDAATESVIAGATPEQIAEAVADGAAEGRRVRELRGEPVTGEDPGWYRRAA
jgi:inosine/xanthosine triphosphate pyrophosphatase family protein